MVRGCKPLQSPRSIYGSGGLEVKKLKLGDNPREIDKKVYYEK